MPVAELVHVVAVEIHDAPAVERFQPDAGRRLQGVEARGGERLVQEEARVLGEQRASRVAQRALLPGFPPPRKVDVSFRGQVLLHGLSPRWMRAWMSSMHGMRSAMLSTT